MDGDRRAEVLTVSIIFFVIASVFVALRFVSRLWIVRKVGLHDYLMLLAWLIDFGFSFSLFYATSKGLGLHEDDIKPQNRPALNRANYAFTVLYNPALMSVKTSILVFYLTLTKGEKVFRWANYVTLFVVNAAGLALTFVNVFQCHPIQAAFAYTAPSESQCTDILTLYLSSSPVNIITDLAILFLPMPILTQMRLPRKQKYILVLTFSFGFFVAVVDVVRIVSIQNAAISRQLAVQAVHLSDAQGDDISWYASISFMWSVVEVNASVICACVPSLKPLVARIIPKMIKDTGDETAMTVENSRAANSSPAVAPSQHGTSNQKSSPSQSPSASARNKSSHHTGSGSSASIEGRRDNTEGSLNMLEFLNDGQPAPPRDIEVNTMTATSTSYPHSITFFDFVNMKKPTSMLKLNNKESIAPIALTTILFFMWGFAYGLLDILNGQFQQIVRLDTWRSMGLHAVYFGGYLVGPPLVGRTVLKKWGFKSTFITGLCIYGCGTLVFWPSAVLASYSAFSVSNFIVGFGLAVLETAANPFIALCGPLENSEIRLNISQGVQAVGSVVSPLLAKKVLFKQVTDVASLVDVQWTYLGIALFDVLLAVAFYYLPVPEASDEDLEELANHRREDNMTKVLGVPVVWLTLGLGVFSQFFYVAGQEVLSLSFEGFVTFANPKSHLDPYTLLTVGHSVFAVGRFLTAFAQFFLKPRWLLMVAYVGMIVFSIIATKTTGNTAIAATLCIYLFESGAFSIIFAISLRGTAAHTKTAASLLAMAVSGGVFFPFAQHAAEVARGSAYSYNVLVALFAAGAIFPLYLNLVPAAKKQVDPVPDEYLRRPRRRRHHKGTSASAAAAATAEKNNTRGTGTETPPVLHRPKENPATGGVLSRRRSVLSDSLETMQLPDGTKADPEREHEHEHEEEYASGEENHTMHTNTNTDDTASEYETTRPGGGMMHDLAPWPES